MLQIQESLVIAFHRIQPTFPISSISLYWLSWTEFYKIKRSIAFGIMLHILQGVYIEFLWRLKANLFIDS